MLLYTTLETRRAEEGLEVLMSGHSVEATRRQGMRASKRDCIIGVKGRQVTSPTVEQIASLRCPSTHKRVEAMSNTDARRYAFNPLSQTSDLGRAGTANLHLFRDMYSLQWYTIIAPIPRSSFCFGKPCVWRLPRLIVVLRHLVHLIGTARVPSHHLGPRVSHT